MRSAGGTRTGPRRRVRFGSSSRPTARTGNERRAHTGQLPVMAARCSDESLYAAWISTTASPTSRTGYSRPPAVLEWPPKPLWRSVPGPWTGSASSVWSWTTRRATKPRAGSPHTADTTWKGPNAVPPCTTTDDMTCTCTPASEVLEAPGQGTGRSHDRPVGHDPRKRRPGDGQAVHTWNSDAGWGCTVRAPLPVVRSIAVVPSFGTVTTSAPRASGSSRRPADPR